MVVRTRFRSFFRYLALYICAAAAITYFGFSAFNGDHGITAQRQYGKQKQELTDELAQLQTERTGLEQRISLLKPETIDPDILEEKSREMLGLVNPDDVVVMQPH